MQGLMDLITGSKKAIFNPFILFHIPNLVTEGHTSVLSLLARQGDNIQVSYWMASKFWHCLSINESMDGYAWILYKK